MLPDALFDTPAPTKRPGIEGGVPVALHPLRYDASLSLVERGAHRKSKGTTFKPGIPILPIYCLFLSGTVVLQLSGLWGRYACFVRQTPEWL